MILNCLNLAPSYIGLETLKSKYQHAHHVIRFYGDGNNLANYPSVAGQQVGYLVSSLKAYRSKERNAGEQSFVMQSIAENLNDNEIDALSNYIHGLYK